MLSLNLVLTGLLSSSAEASIDLFLLCNIMFHESRVKGPKSCLTNIFDCVRVMTGSGDRVSSWAAAVVVDRFYATCP